jgi:hydrogenase maturation protease
MSDSSQARAADGTVVIGTGNPFRSDDGVGPMVAQLLRKRVPQSVVILERDGEATGLMSAWENCASVILIDAVFGGQNPGRVYRFDLKEQTLPPGLFRFSTHAFGLPEAVELARSLDRLPATALLYGIEGSNFRPGEGLTPEVRQSADRVVEFIIDELDKNRES